MRLLIFVVLVAFATAFAVPRLAHALDCPCTWEEVICDADAVTEVEMSLATKTSPDHVTIRRVIWNGTKHPVKVPRGDLYFRLLTKTRKELQGRVKPDPGREPGRPEALTVPLYREALRTGSYRTVLFLEYSVPGTFWGGGGLVINGVEWLDHPLHDEWWNRVQPLLAERIRLYGTGKKPAACNVTRETTRFAKFDLYGYDSALELSGDKRVIP
jgi:hypothetical protein